MSHQLSADHVSPGHGSSSARRSWIPETATSRVCSTRKYCHPCQRQNQCVQRDSITGNSYIISSILHILKCIWTYLFPLLQTSPIKHIKLSPRSPSYMANGGLLAVSTKMPASPRRMRGETKKCRKVYGMDHRELWCTQCKWKKACSRFGD